MNLLGELGLLCICLLFTLFSFAQQAPISITVQLDPSQPETLGLDYLSGVETYTVFAPDSNDRKYNHGVVLYPFKDKLYTMWQSSWQDEDAPETQVYYSYSEDLIHWSEPTPLTNEWNEGITTSGGWWSHGDTLVAFINVWPDSIQPKGGFTQYMLSTDGVSWSQPDWVLDDQGNRIAGIIEQDLRKLTSSRLLTAFHVQPGLHAKPYYTDDPLGINGWTQGNMNNLPFKEEMSRELEPSWFLRKHGSVVMIFRDQSGSFQKLASISYDRGESWTTPELSDIPDSRSKQSAGNLPDGRAFMVFNPSGSKTRIPLAIYLSSEGDVFDQAYLLRSGSPDDLQPMRYAGNYKRVGYSYPKSVVWKDHVYVGYATNKEDVQITVIPISELIKILGKE